MAYKPTEWINTLKDADGNVIQRGTPYTAENMNKIENQLVALDDLPATVASHGEDLTAQSQHIQQVEERVEAVEKSKAQPNGIATLGADGIIPSSQLPSNLKEIRLVNSMDERDALETFEGLRVMVMLGESWKEYVWNGTEYIKTADSENLNIVLTWGNITDKPESFPPSSHTHKIDDIAELQKSLDAKVTPDAVQKKVDALSGVGNTKTVKMLDDELDEHSRDKNNPHAIKSDQITVITPKHNDDLPNSYPEGVTAFNVVSQGYPYSFGIVLTVKSGVSRILQFFAVSTTGSTAKDRIWSRQQIGSNTWSAWREQETTDGSQEKVNTHEGKQDIHVTKTEKDTWNELKVSVELLSRTVAEWSNHTHSYSSLTGKPTIPTKTSQLTNNSEFVKSNAGRIHVSYSDSDIPPLQPNDIVLKVI